MTDFLSRLAKRQLDNVPQIRPRVPSMYAIAAPAMSVDGEERSAPPELIIPVAGSETVVAPTTPPHADREARTVPAAYIEASVPSPTNSPIHKENDVTSGAIFRPMVKTPVAMTASGPTVSDQHAGFARPSDLNTDDSPRPAIRALETPLNHVAISIESPSVTHETRDNSRTESLSASPSLPARPSLRFAVPGSEAAEPEVHVTIGRIEVTAVHAPPSPKRVPAPGKKPMSLDDYLAKRNGGRR